MPRSRLYEIARFVLVGGACFVLDYGLLYVLTEYVGLYYLLSAGISFSVSVFVNYWLCLACVFRGADTQTRRAKMLFFGSSIAGLGLNQLLMWLLVDFAHIYYMIAKLIAAGIVMIWNYVLKRRAVLGH
ncbi:GtrA family protein [Selenomonas noxia]